MLYKFYSAHIFCKAISHSTLPVTSTSVVNETQDVQFPLCVGRGSGGGGGMRMHKCDVHYDVLSRLIRRHTRCCWRFEE